MKRMIKITRRLIFALMITMFATPALAIVCVATGSTAKECAYVCGVDMWWAFPACF